MNSGSDAPAPAITLTATEGPHQGRVFTLSGHETFLFGRSKHAHVQLSATDRYFSRVHFMVESNPPRCRLTDMGSHNGTYVNGQRVEGAVDLSHGDLVRAGHTVFSIALPASQRVVCDTQVAVTITMPAEGDVAPAPEAAAAPAPKPITQILPRIEGFEILREIGRGGMGVVYEAVRRSDGTRIALKTIVPAVAGSPIQMERFLRETRILCQLAHPHIVAFRATGESNGMLWFAMDYVEGTDAAKLLKKHGPLPAAIAVRMICQLLGALQYAHDAGFVHRDIKPDNLLIAQQGARKTIKLGDFGLARVYHASQLSGLTLQGEVGGTLTFMAPEQITSFREVKPAADQYSAAATLYNLLSGRHVYNFKAKGPAALAMILTEQPVPLEQRRPDLPAGLSEVIHRALSREPRDRYPSVGHLRSALAAFSR